MFPKYHLILGILFVIILHFVFPQLSWLHLCIIFLSSFLIDIDHFIYYAYKKKLNLGFKTLREAYEWHKDRWRKEYTLSKEQRKKLRNPYGFYFFHGIEWIVILFLLGNICSLLKYIGMGFLFHLFTDLAYSFFNEGNLNKISVVYNFYKNHKEF